MSTINVESASGAVYHIDYTPTDTVSTLKHRLRQRDWDAWAVQDKIAMQKIRNASSNHSSNNHTPRNNNNHIPDTKYEYNDHTSTYDKSMETGDQFNTVELDTELDKDEFDSLLTSNGERLSNSTPISILLNNKKLYYRLKQYPTYTTLLLYRLQQQHITVQLFVNFIICFIGALFVAAFAQASFNLPQSWSVYLNLSNAVPITFQTFAVMIISTLLGSIRGFIALGIYACLIAMGCPFGALGSGGVSVLIGGSAGYIYGFIIASIQLGYCAERGWDRSWLWTIWSMVIGNFIIYALGLIYLPFGIGIADGITAHDAVCGYGRGCVGNTFMYGMVCSHIQFKLFITNIL